MKLPLLHHLKQIHNNPCINDDLGLQNSLIKGPIHDSDYINRDLQPDRGCC